MTHNIQNMYVSQTKR